MKLLHIIMSTNPACGGPSAVVREQCELLIQHGVEPTVVTIDNPNSPWLANEKYAQIGVGHGLTGYGFFNGLDKWLDEHVNEFDRVIVHGLWGGHVFPAHKYAVKRNVPYFVLPHGMLDPWFKQFKLKHLKKHLFWHWAEYPLLRDAQKVLFTCQSEMEKSYHSFKRYSVNPEVVTAGVQAIAAPENARSIVESEIPETADKKIILFMSRLHPIKGLENLINAWAEIEDYREYLLMIAGPSNDEFGESMINLVKNKSISNIVFPGMVKGELRASLLGIADLFIQPSFLESFGMSVVEALSAGTPVLVTDNVGVYQEVLEYESGLVSKPAKKSILQNLEKWFEMSPEDKNRMSKNALSCFDEKFEISNAVKSLLSVIGADS